MSIPDEENDGRRYGFIVEKYNSTEKMGDYPGVAWDICFDENEVADALIVILREYAFFDPEEPLADADWQRIREKLSLPLYGPAKIIYPEKLDPCLAVREVPHSFKISKVPLSERLIQSLASDTVENKNPFA